MNCEEFQLILPDIVDGGGNGDEEAHLRSCPTCSTLTDDLRYISAQAKLLLPMRDPNPRVWQNIQHTLRNEGLMPEGRTPLIGQITLAGHFRNWTSIGWVMAAACVLMMVVVLVNYQPGSGGRQSDPGKNAMQNISSAAPFDAADEQLIQRIAQQQPAMQAAYQDSLKDVNSYIVDARKAVDENPDDAMAQQRLLNAYDQKAMLYEMATVRTLQ